MWAVVQVCECAIAHKRLWPAFDPSQPLSDRAPDAGVGG